MYLPVDPKPSSARAWVAAASAVKAAGGEAYNVIIDIADPIAEDAADTAIIQEVDRYLRAHNTYSVATVANTIFPESTLRRYGPVDFYDAYRDRVFPRMKALFRSAQKLSAAFTEITVRIPADLARRLGTGGEVERRVLEALSLEEFRQGHLGRVELRRLLGFRHPRQAMSF